MIFAYNVSGFHIDPGYKGRLVFAVYNAGPSTLPMKYGERLFSLWIADLDSTDDRPRKKAGYDSIPTSLTQGPKTLSSLASLVERLDNAEKKLDERQQDLVKRLDVMESKVETHRVQQALYLGVIVTITVAFLPLAPAATTYLLDRYLPSNIKNTQPEAKVASPQPASKPKSP